MYLTVELTPVFTRLENLYGYLYNIWSVIKVKGFIPCVRHTLLKCGMFWPYENLFDLGHILMSNVRTNLLGPITFKQATNTFVSIYESSDCGLVHFSFVWQEDILIVVRNCVTACWGATRSDYCSDLYEILMVKFTFTCDYQVNLPYWF